MLNKTSIKFVLGFLAIIIVSIAILAILGSLE